MLRSPVPIAYPSRASRPNMSNDAPRYSASSASHSAAISRLSLEWVQASRETATERRLNLATGDDSCSCMSYLGVRAPPAASSTREHLPFPLAPGARPVAMLYGDAYDAARPRAHLILAARACPIWYGHRLFADEAAGCAAGPFGGHGFSFRSLFHRRGGF
jgi:hypothetical protein